MKKIIKFLLYLLIYNSFYCFRFVNPVFSQENQNNKLTCQQAIDSVKSDLIKRQIFIPSTNPQNGNVPTKPTLTFDKNFISEQYQNYPRNRTQTISINLSGNENKIYNFYNSPQLMESISAKIIGACEYVGIVDYNALLEEGVPVGYFPDGSVRTFIWVDSSSYLLNQWGYYTGP